MIRVKNLKDVEFPILFATLAPAGQEGDAYDITDEIKSWKDETAITAIVNDELILDNGVSNFSKLDSIAILFGSAPVDAKVTSIAPFGEKSNHNFNGIGKEFSILAGETKELVFDIPASDFGFDFTGVELWSDKPVISDKGEMYVKYGDTIVNQFAFTWNIKPNVCDKALPYNATLVYGLKICVLYTNNGEDKNIYINYDLHKRKS